MTQLAPMPQLIQQQSGQLPCEHAQVLPQPLPPQTRPANPAPDVAALPLFARDQLHQLRAV